MRTGSPRTRSRDGGRLRQVACRCSRQLGVLGKKYGERAGIRTQDLAIKSRVLYQLSYALVTRR